VLLLVATGCGSDPVNPPPDDSTPDGGDGSPDAGDTAPALCAQGPGYIDDSFPALELGDVTTTVLTLDGKPAADVLVEVCGVNACTSPQQTDSAGEVAITVGTPTQKPAIKVGDAYTFGEYAVLFDGTKDGTDFGMMYAPALPSVGAPLAPGERAESNGVAVTLDAGGKLAIDRFAPYDTEEGRAFRAAEFPRDKWPNGLDHGANLELVFLLAPEGGKLCPPATFELPNSRGWKPGTAVEFLLQGLDAGLAEGAQEFAPYGEWQPFATGKVDDTGERLVPDDGGLPVIANVGVRRL